MKKYILLTALLQLGMTPVFANIANAEDLVPIRLGSLEVYPVLDVKESQDDNIFASSNTKKSSWITTVEPAVKVVSKSGGSSIEMNYQLSSGYYNSSSDDDFVDQLANIKTTLGITKRLNFDLWADYNKDHDKRGLTFNPATPGAVATPDRYHRIRAGGKASYGVNGHIDISGEYGRKRYENNRTLNRTLKRDYDSVGGIFAFAFPIALKTTAVLEARYKRFNYKLFSPTFNLDSNEQRYFAGLDWVATAKTTGRLRLGYLRKSFTNPALANGTQFSWEFGMTWKPMSYSTWRLSTFSLPLESDSSTSTTYIESTAAKLKWRHEWSGYFSHTAKLGYSKNIYKGSIRRDKLTTAAIVLDYKVFRWLAVGAGYKFTNRNSNSARASYRQNIYGFTLTGTL